MPFSEESPRSLSWQASQSEPNNWRNNSNKEDYMHVEESNLRFYTRCDTIYVGEIVWI